MTGSNTGGERDYAGVPTAELASLYEEMADCDHRTFAERIGMNERDLKKIVVSQKYPFTGILWADKIVLGLGENISSLISDGRLHLIPARGSRNAARKIVEDSLILGVGESVEEARLTIEQVIERGLLPAAAAADIEEQIEDLLSLRINTAAPTPEQTERLRLESEAAKERLARKRAEAKADIAA